MYTRALVRTIAAILVLAGGIAAAQKGSQTASQFYLDYRKAFDKATKIDDLMPYMSTKTPGPDASMSAADKDKMFKMVKAMNTYTNVKIVKETPTKDGATLTVEGVDADKAQAKGTVELVKEKGEWKILKESWSS
jgi:hypothetical protein